VSGEKRYLDLKHCRNVQRILNETRNQIGTLRWEKYQDKYETELLTGVDAGIAMTSLLMIQDILIRHIDQWNYKEGDKTT